MPINRIKNSCRVRNSAKQNKSNPGLRFGRASSKSQRSDQDDFGDDTTKKSNVSGPELNFNDHTYNQHPSSHCSEKLCDLGTFHSNLETNRMRTVKIVVVVVLNPPLHSNAQTSTSNCWAGTTCKQGFFSTNQIQARQRVAAHSC